VNLAALIPLLLSASMGLVVLSIGMRTPAGETTYLLQHRDLLLRSVVSMNVVMPLLVVLAVLIFNLAPAIKIAIAALALSPVPPILPGAQTKAGGGHAYIISLLVMMAVLSIVIVPLGVLGLGQIFEIDGVVGMRVIAPAVLISVIVPLLIGLVLNAWVPDLAAKAYKPVALVGAAALVLALVPVLVAQWAEIVAAFGNGTLVVLTIFSLAGVAVGHCLGGPDPDNRSVLALATSARHPGVALATTAVLFPDQPGVLAVVVIHVVLAALVTLPYARWRQRLHGDHRRHSEVTAR
jgi:BASS family bile acid:Na+ symporter